MNLLKYIFFTLIAVFIAIGDAVLWLWKKGKKIRYGRFPRRKLLKGEFIFSSQQKSLKKKTPQASHGGKMRSYSIFNQLKILFGGVKYIFLTTLIFLARFLKAVLVEVGFFIKAFFLLPKTLFDWTLYSISFVAKKIFGRVIFQREFNIGARVIAKKEKEIRRQKIKHYKPGFFYKLKYVFVGLIFSFIFLFLPMLFLLFVAELPNPYSLSANYIPKTTKIYDRNGELLYEIFANQNRTIVRLFDIPLSVRNATIAIEDKDFYTHPGFDVRGIARAFVSNIQKKGLQGGSTITQQLIKSAFFSSEPSIVRKVKELVLAFWAERVYTKDQILELYFNYVPYGGTAWGVESASEIYFGKHVSELDLGEAAFLAGLPRAPSVYSPYVGNGTLWKKRQKEVLDAMVKQGYITQDQSDLAYAQELNFKTPEVSLKAPHFVMYVRNELIKRYGITDVERGGLQVKTSLDIKTQQQAESIVLNEVENDQYLNIHNGAALITNPSNGDILAMVGSKNYFDNTTSGNVNITTSLRQPGSTIKVITYTLALKSGYTEATILDDSPFVISNQWETYAPVNYDGVFHGKVPIRTAFANSFNIPAVRMAQKLGVDSIVSFGKEMGITSWGNPSQYGLSITLGGAEVKMTDLATAYGVIANSGQRVDLDPILEVKDSNGKIVYAKTPQPQRVVDTGVAFIISDILADNNARTIEFGQNSPLVVPGKRVSVKTGTTDNKRDNWTVGFTKDLLVATWVGNNDNTPMSQALASGITGAAPIWNKIMSGLLNNGEATSSAFIPPDIIKKSCLGQDRYFVRGTENSVSCFYPTPSVSPTPKP